ncbi:hypothetical protein BC829DRAFT_416970 [Chytridium lagenaria]|nr:hypothetical protein BC829DRAFT_416970 [Chytridium lagenaria]
MSTPLTKKTPSNMASAPSSTPVSIEESIRQYTNIISRMDARMEDLLLEVKALREDNVRLQQRLDAKDAEIHRLNREALKPTVATAPEKTPPTAAPAEGINMETEDGEVLEELSATKLAAFKADLTRTVVAELIVAMKEEGIARPTPLPRTQRPLPPTFSVNFDVNAPRPSPGPLSFAAAARQIARGNATPDHAARVVFRSTYPRSTVPGVTNLYMRGYVQRGPKRYLMVRNALLAIGIDSGVMEMSFIGQSVVHLMCDSSKAAFIEKKLIDKGVFLPAFDPLEVPQLNVASSKSHAEREKEGRLNCTKRLGALYSRGGQQIKQACLEGLDDTLAEEVRTQARIYAEERQRRDAELIFRQPEMTAEAERPFAYPRKIARRRVEGPVPSNPANINTFEQLSDNDEEMDDSHVASDTNTQIDLIAVVETWLSPTDGVPLKRVLVNGTAPPRPRHVDGKATGRKGQWEVLMAAPGEQEIGAEVLGVDAGGKWTAIKVGILVVIVGYLPPMAGHGLLARTMLEEFDAFREGICQQHPTYPIIVVGDFNARMGVLTGDVNVVGDNHRRVWMQNWMGDPEWTRLEPSRGKWTTHARNGHGITDFVFLNTAALPIAPDLVVHETSTMGSDHSLLTIDIPLPTPFWKPPFSRINISKLDDDGLSCGIPSDKPNGGMG